jgi:hypothetical protein
VHVGLAQLANDTISVRRVADRLHRRIVSWNRHATGSHWAAHGAPGTWIEDVQGFLRELQDP